MRNKKNARRAGRTMLLLLFLAAFSFGVFQLVSFVMADTREENALRGLAGLKSVPADLPTAAEAPTVRDEPRVILPQYAALHDQNPDFFGWLYIEDTNIDYPVMFAPDRPDYYLHRDFECGDSGSGMLFIDERCPAEGNFYLIYGHHMASGNMFGRLPAYGSADYGATHAVIRFDTLYEQREYVLFAAFYSQIYGEFEDGGFRYYDYTDLTEEEAFYDFVRQVKDAAIYDTGVDAVFGDELLALSTCNYHTDDGRFVVVAKRVA